LSVISRDQRIDGAPIPLPESGSDRITIDGDYARGPIRDHAGRPRHTVEYGDLPEGVAREEFPGQLPFDDDIRAAAQQHVVDVLTLARDHERGPGSDLVYAAVL
jgi:hypothetical protein